MCSIAFLPHKSRHDAEVPIWQVPVLSVITHTNMVRLVVSLLAAWFSHSILEVAPTVTTNTTSVNLACHSACRLDPPSHPRTQLSKISKISKGHNMMPLKAGGYKIGVSPIRNTDSLMSASDIQIWVLAPGPGKKINPQTRSAHHVKTILESNLLRQSCIFPLFLYHVDCGVRSLGCGVCSMKHGA